MNERENEPQVILMRLPVVFRYPVLDNRSSINLDETVLRSILEKIERDEEFTEEEDNALDLLADLDYLSSCTDEELTDLEDEVIEAARENIPSFIEHIEELNDNEVHYCKFFVVTEINENGIRLVSTDDTNEELLDDVVTSMEDFYGSYVYLHDFFADNRNTEKMFQLFEKRIDSTLEWPYDALILLLYRLENMYLCVNAIETENGDIAYNEYFVIDENTLFSNYDFVDNIKQTKTSKEIYTEVVNFINQKMLQKSDDDYETSYDK